MAAKEGRRRRRLWLRLRQQDRGTNSDGQGRGSRGERAEGRGGIDEQRYEVRTEARGCLLEDWLTELS
jgi:hypothetical protein